MVAEVVRFRDENETATGGMTSAETGVDPHSVPPTRDRPYAPPLVPCRSTVLSGCRRPPGRSARPSREDQRRKRDGPARRDGSVEVGPGQRGPRPHRRPLGQRDGQHHDQRLLPASGEAGECDSRHSEGEVAPLDGPDQTQHNGLGDNCPGNCGNQQAESSVVSGGLGEEQCEETPGR